MFRIIYLLSQQPTLMPFREHSSNSESPTSKVVTSILPSFQHNTHPLNDKPWVHGRTFPVVASRSWNNLPVCVPPTIYPYLHCRNSWLPKRAEDNHDRAAATTMSLDDTISHYNQMCILKPPDVCRSKT